MKTCFKCGETKPLDDFYSGRGMRDGRRNPCKTCYLEESRRLRNRAALDPKWREKHRAECRAWWARSGKRRTTDREWLAKRRVSLELYNKKHPNQREAHQAVNNAVRNGALVKPTPLSAMWRRTPTP